MNQKFSSSILDYAKINEKFPDTDVFLEKFRSPSFHSLSSDEKEIEICQFLLKKIQEAPEPAFLLPPLLHLIHDIDASSILPLPFRWNTFEFWLNQSSFSEEEQLKIRAKIAGKYLPRSSYQIFFPIGMNKHYEGPHFVAAHLSPDTDTTVASFWGWLDAFAARVASGCHYWFLPGGPPDSPFTTAFEKMIGPSLFSTLPLKDLAVPIRAIDLISSKQTEQTEFSSGAILSFDTPLEEVKEALKEHPLLKVVWNRETSTLSLGTIDQKNRRDQGLGTISFRDFSNFEEIRMPPCLDLISVIDHHKTSLNTSSVPILIIGDAQSSNVLIAEMMFRLNDTYSSTGRSVAHILKEIETLGSPNSLLQIRLLRRLLKRLLAAHQTSSFYVHPRREFHEYLSFLYAILDDTDLLTKVSARDLDCICELLNRLKSIAEEKEIKILHFDDIPRDQHFVKSASARILQQEDMYAIYKEIYSIREEEVETHLKNCAQGLYSNIFLDSKTQNGCARVGQTKLFCSNSASFLLLAPALRRFWYQNAKKCTEENPNVHLYLHMISTVASAEEVYRQNFNNYSHQDELWLSTDGSSEGLQQLGYFLKGFQKVLQPILETVSVELIGSDTESLEKEAREHFNSLKLSESSQKEPAILVIRFKAGSVNSRKSMISPFLPKK